MNAWIRLFFAFSVLPFASMASSDIQSYAGWNWLGFGVDRHVPWMLQIDRKAIESNENTYLVVYGFLGISEDSLILYPSEEDFRSGKTSNAILVGVGDSPALEWLELHEGQEGFYAIGGVFSRGVGTDFFGHLTGVRFAMKKDAKRRQDSEG